MKTRQDGGRAYFETEEYVATDDEDKDAREAQLAVDGYYMLEDVSDDDYETDEVAISIEFLLSTKLKLSSNRKSADLPEVQHSLRLP